MSDEFSDPASTGVSPLRKKISSIILIVLLVVLAIELRAIAGQNWSAEALQAKAPEGGFENRELKHADVLALLSLGPSESVERETDKNVEYKYSWGSLLRPVMGKPESAIYIVYRKDSSDEKWAAFYSTDPMSDGERAAAERDNKFEARQPDWSDTMENDGSFSGGGPGGSGRDESGNGGPPRDREGADGGPPVDPATSLLDTNKDGTLSASELDAAAESLLAGDTNGDGKLSGDELRPAFRGGPPGGGQTGRRRPPMDDENDSETEDVADSGPDSNSSVSESAASEGSSEEESTTASAANEESPEPASSESEPAASDSAPEGKKEDAPASKETESSSKEE